jgi:hypothetical protein
MAFHTNHEMARSPIYAVVRVSIALNPQVSNAESVGLAKKGIRDWATDAITYVAYQYRYDI